MFGDTDRVRIRDLRHRDAAIHRSLQVDMIGTNARGDGELQLRCFGDAFGRLGTRRAGPFHDQSVYTIRRTSQPRTFVMPKHPKSLPPTVPSLVVQVLREEHWFGENEPAWDGASLS